MLVIIPTPLLTHTSGDATQPRGNDNRLIIHCCNNIGGWGAGFVLAISRHWLAPESEYHAWHNTAKGNLPMGDIQIVPVEQNLAVCNMIGQWGTSPDSKGRPPIRYRAIRKCLKKVCKYCLQNNVSVHAPKFGSDLAGGDWNKIESLIIKELCNKGVKVTIYEWAG